MLSDKGSRSIYVDRFWGQVLRKHLWEPKAVLMPTFVGNKLFIRQYMMDTH